VADCAQLDQQAQQIANTLATLAVEGNKASSYNVVSADIAEGLGSEAARILININQNLANLDKIKSEQERGGCTVTGYLPQIRAAKAAQVNLNTFIDKADKIIFEAKKQAEATQKATTTQNNAGNGTPGSAGTASNADQLTGVTVTGQKKPTVPQGAGANGAGATGADALTEVKVTGKTNPDALTEVNVQSKKNPAELDTVNITSKKNIDELSEVSIASQRPSNVTGLKQEARQQATFKDALEYASQGDWRVRLSLADAGKYLYQAADPGILAPLAKTKGILFPYTPSINVTYMANYDLASIQHSNYKIPQYQNSSVEQFTISCDFTAQSVAEANYILAVIHFLRSVTKMFYGKDSNPIRGTPPPLCYLTGLGQYQFNAHPLLINSFSYALPTDVDYIKAFSPSSFPSKDENPTPQGGRINQSTGNQAGAAGKGGTPNPPNFSTGENAPTYVPTKINIQIGAIPVVPRAVMSNDFSVAEYAKGALLLGKYNSSGGGIW